MSAAILSELERAGIIATVVDGKLRLSAPPGALTDALRASVLAEKQALLNLLSARGRLQRLANAEGLAAELVIGMDVQDLAAWAWFADQPDGTDGTLRKCLCTLAENGRQA